MNWNNKGFAISGILYTSLILFITLMFGILLMATNRKVILDKEKSLVLNQIDGNRNNNEIYRDESGAPSPKLTSGMIPIFWDGSKWVKANIKNKWYDYDEKKWANAVLVTASTRTNYIQAPAGTPISEADVLAYLVWIPRYRYKLFNVSSASTSPREIEIEFENRTMTKSVGTNNGQWLTHPAFTFGTDELDGFWVGKFETTGDATTPTVKPGIVSLRNQNVSTQFNTAKIFNNQTVYGLTSQFDAHMMKNTEWGAVSYLSHSKYGKNGEIEVNGNLSRLTSSMSNVNQSTTGNIYGVYDMAGGSWEAVMAGMYTDGTRTKVIVGQSGFTEAQLTLSNQNFIGGKYIDIYDYVTNNSSYNLRILGDATSETKEWYNSFAVFISASSPWFLRSGYFVATGGGPFYFYINSGTGSNDFAFRLAISGN